MKLFLCGGGSNDKTIEANKVFNEIIDNSKPLLYVPLAMDPIKHPYDGCLEWIKGEMKNVDIPYIEMVETFDDLANKNYYDHDGVVFGGSAGAIIFGYDINSCLPMDKNDVNLGDTKGFDVLNGVSLFAHYTNNEEKTKEYTEALQDYTTNHEQVIALPEEDTIFINGDDIQVIGNKDYYKFKAGERINIQAQEETCILRK